MQGQKLMRGNFVATFFILPSYFVFVSARRVTLIQISQTPFLEKTLWKQLGRTRKRQRLNACQTKICASVSRRDSFIVTSQFPRRSLLGTKAVSSLCCGQVKTAQWPHDTPINRLEGGKKRYLKKYWAVFIGALVSFGRFLIAPPTVARTVVF